MKDLDRIAREQREIAARQKRLEERRRRILDVNLQKRCVDKEIIEQQLREQQERKLRELQRQREEDELLNQYAQDSLKAEREAQARKRLAQRQIYEEQLLQAQEREERLAALAEAERNDTEQDTVTFQGEDPHIKQRQRMQAQQQRAWVAEGVSEKRRIREENDAQIRRIEEEQLRADELAVQQQLEAEKARRQRNREVTDYNRQLEKQRLEEKHRREREEAEAELRDVDAQVKDLHLRDTQAGTRRLDNPNRAIPYNFRGFTAQEQLDILNEQKRQIEEKLARQEQEKREADALAKKFESARRSQISEDRQRRAAAMHKHRELQKDQLQQMSTFRKQQDEIKQTYAYNPVDNSFFDQFGTSAR